MSDDHPTVELPVITGAHHATPAAAAARRVAYHLLWERQPRARGFAPGVLRGGTIADPGHPDGRRSAEWFDSRPVSDPDSEIVWVLRYMGMAVHEAVHAVLADFHVDGAPAIDPTGPAAQTVRGCVEELAVKLAIIATTPHLH